MTSARFVRPNVAVILDYFASVSPHRRAGKLALAAATLSGVLWAGTAWGQTDPAPEEDAEGAVPAPPTGDWHEPREAPATPEDPPAPASDDAREANTTEAAPTAETTEAPPTAEESTPASAAKKSRPKKHKPRWSRRTGLQTIIFFQSKAPSAELQVRLADSRDRKKRWFPVCVTPCVAEAPNVADYRIVHGAVDARPFVLPRNATRVRVVDKQTIWIKALAPVDRYIA